MAHSIQQVTRRTAIVNDLDLIALVAIWCRLSNDFPMLVPWITRWRSELANYGPGTIDLHLDEMEEDPSSLDAMTKLIGRGQNYLRTLGEIVPASVLQECVSVPGVRFGDCSVQELIVASAKLGELLRSEGD